MCEIYNKCMCVSYYVQYADGCHDFHNGRDPCVKSTINACVLVVKYADGCHNFHNGRIQV